MFEVLTDSVPYPDLEKREITDFDFKNKVVNENYRPRFNVPVKKSLKNLIERCWSDNRDERPTFEEIFDKLSNKHVNKKDGGDDDDDNDYLLDDVDVDELNLYVEDVTEVNDATEKLLSRISELETENKQLKNEINELRYIIGMNEMQKNDLMQELNKSQNELQQANNELYQLKNEKKQNMQYIVIAGFNEYNQIFTEGNDRDQYNRQIVSPPRKLSIIPSHLLSYSVYGEHSVIIMKDLSLKGIGRNFDGRIDGRIDGRLDIRIDGSCRNYSYFFHDLFFKDSNNGQLVPVAAVCGLLSTLYMFTNSNKTKRQLVFCDCEIKGGPVFLDIGNHEPVALFGGYYHSASIGSEGEVIFFNRDSVINSPNSPIKAVSLPDGEKASSVACCNDSVAVLSSKGRVFLSDIEKNKILKFSKVVELEGQEIVCLSGTCKTFLAVNKEGRVFGKGLISHIIGKIETCVSSFIEITQLEGYEIAAAYAGFNHSLFQTREGKIISCGQNRFGELLLQNSSSREFYSPTETFISSGATFCIAGGFLSVVFIGCEPPPNTPNMRIHYD